MSDLNLEILIQIKEELAGLNKARSGLVGAKKEAIDFGDALKQGLGIGSGIAIAAGAIAMLKGTLVGAAKEAFRFAGETKDMSEALGLSTTRVQTLRIEFEKAGVDIGSLNAAIAKQTESLAEARDASTTAARAYRTLGLEASAIEQLSVDERMIAVARAFDAAKDKTAAFTAAAQILGSRGLPQLLSALRSLGSEGVDALERLYQKQGLIMGDDTIQRLDAAEKQWGKFWRGIVIGSGEAIGTVDRLVESLKKAPWETLLAVNARVMSGPYGGQQLLDQVLNKHAPQRPAGASGGFGSTAPGGTYDSKNIKAAADADEAAARRVKDALDAAQKAGADRIAAINREGEALRQSLLTPAEEYAEEMTRIKRLFDEGGITGDFRTRAEAAASQRRDERTNAAVDGRLTEFFGPLDQQSAENYGAGGGTGVNEMSFGQGAMAGVQAWLQDVGSTGQQVASTLRSTLGSALDSLSSDIFLAIKGTQSWSEAWKNLGAMAVQMLAQMIIKMILFKTISMFLGAIGLPIPSVAMAGGGSFVTSGPTKLTVGDNPGGVELVNVIPLSGVGRSTINGHAVKMGGGGSLIAGSGMRGSSSGLAAPVHVAFNFATGLSTAIRAEVMSMAPELRALAIEAVSDAHKRNALRFA